MVGCVIVGISQEMNFETNSVVSFLLLRLPTGTEIRAAVDDATAATVVEQHVGARGAPSSPPPAPRAPAPPSAPAPEEEDSVTLFGGDAVADDAEAFAIPPLPAEERPSPVQIRTSDGKPYVPARTVQMDENGYPVVGNSMDPTDFTGIHGLDEDGVSSV